MSRNWAPEIYQECSGSGKFFGIDVVGSGSGGRATTATRPTDDTALIVEAIGKSKHKDYLPVSFATLSNYPYTIPQDISGPLNDQIPESIHVLDDKKLPCAAT